MRLNSKIRCVEVNSELMMQLPVFKTFALKQSSFIFKTIFKGAYITSFHVFFLLKILIRGSCFTCVSKAIQVHANLSSSQSY